MAVRRFRHTNGFCDSTDFVELLENGTTWVQDKKGRRWGKGLFSRAECERLVKHGDWVELPPAVAPEFAYEDLGWALKAVGGG